MVRGLGTLKEAQRSVPSTPVGLGGFQIPRTPAAAELTSSSGLHGPSTQMCIYSQRHTYVYTQS